MLPVLCLSVFLVVVDNTIVNVALPTLNRQLGASITSLQWIVDAYSLAFAGLLLAGGGIGDRLGRKGTMQVGLDLLRPVLGGGRGVRTRPGTLITARALMGVAAAFIFPASLAILTTIFPDPSPSGRRRSGIWGATSGIAVAFGPVVGGALLEHFWYGSIFLVNVPIVVVTLVGRPGPHPQHPQDLGPPLRPAGRAHLHGRSDEPRARHHRGTAVGLDLAGHLGLLRGGRRAPDRCFTLLELRTEEPLLDVRVFTIPRFTGGALSISVAFFCLFGFIFLITQYFQFVKGYSTLSAGVHTLPFAIVAAIATPLAAVLALKIGTRVVVAAGLVLMASGLVVAAFNSEANTTYFGPIIVSMVLLALGLSSITAPATEAVMGSVPDEQRGAAAGVNNTTRELGGTLGVAVFGSIFASAYAPRIIDAFRRLPIPAARRPRPTSRWRRRSAWSSRLRTACNRSSSRWPSCLPQRIADSLPGRCRRGGTRRVGRLVAPAWTWRPRRHARIRDRDRLRVRTEAGTEASGDVRQDPETGDGPQIDGRPGVWLHFPPERPEAPAMDGASKEAGQRAPDQRKTTEAPDEPQR